MKMCTDRQKKLNIILMFIIIIAVIVCCGYVGKRFIQHEKSQNQKIEDLYGQVELLTSELDAFTLSEKIEWSDGG